MLINYNQRNPDKQWWPSMPTAGNKEHRMDEQQYHDFLKRRGELILRMSGNVKLNYSEPTERDKKLVQSIFRKATKVAKAQNR